MACTGMMPQRAKNPSGRRGFTLVETVVSISLTTVLFALIAMTLHGLQRVNRQLQAGIPLGVNLSRLATQLREDAHAATGVTIEQPEEGHAVARFTLSPQSSIVYESQAGQVIRRKLQADKPIHQEVYRFPDAQRMDWSTQGDPTVFVTLRLERRPDRAIPSEDALRVYEVMAALHVYSNEEAAR